MVMIITYIVIAVLMWPVFSIANLMHDRKKYDLLTPSYVVCAVVGAIHAAFWFLTVPIGIMALLLIKVDTHLEKHKVETDRRRQAGNGIEV